MPESYGRVLHDEQNEIGYIVREIPESLKELYIIPGFSLFSEDRNAPETSKILSQILKRQVSKMEFVKNLCCKLIDVFFWCTFEEGLIPEMHSQNVVFAFDENWNLKKIVLRDFESIDKDISIRQKLGKTVDFKEYPYKCISSENQYYLRRHSYMYDHKLGEYLLNPIIECAAEELKVNSQEFCNDVQKYVREKYGSRLQGFFPEDGEWYKYPDTEINRETEERPYMSMGTAIFR